MGSRIGVVTSVLTRLAMNSAGVESDSLRFRFREDVGGVVGAILSSMSGIGLVDDLEENRSSSLISTVPPWPSEKVEINFELRVLRRGADLLFDDMALKIRVVSCDNLEVRIVCVSMSPSQ